MRNKLSQSTVEKLGYYVYLLIDPRNSNVFYVGKGKGNRINHHLAGALIADTKETRKIKTIREIEAAGREVDLVILRHGLTSDAAFEVESAVIDLREMKNLTNEVKGHYSAKRGKMSVADIEIEYQAKPAEIQEPVMLININRYYRHDMTPKELYDRTRRQWKISTKRAGTRPVLSTYRGIVREVYTVDRWLKGTMPKKSYFEGAIAPPELRNRYLHRSVAHYLKKGSQNPIKYIDGR